MSLFDISSLQVDLEESTDVPIDLVNQDKIKANLKPYIDADTKVYLCKTL